MSFRGIKPCTFEWTVTLSKKFPPGEQTIKSPEFHLPDSTWCLVFNFHTSQESAKIYLCRRDSGPPKSVTYTIKSFIVFRNIELTRTQNFAGRNSNSEHLTLTEEEITGESIKLLITCDINGYITDKKAEWGLTPSGAQKKNLPDCIQTEAANSVNEKEVPKDEELSSIEMKDAALLSKQMKELLIKSSDHDITICVQDKKFRAHRSILSARSPVFAMMLRHDTKESNTSTIRIEDCDPESFDEFLLYVYSGRTENLTPSSAVKLYYSADKYDFPVLKERCVSLLKTSLSVESICDVVLLAAKHQEETLLKLATEFFARNMKKILVTVAWQKFMTQNPVEANELFLKGVEIINPEN